MDLRETSLRDSRAISFAWSRSDGIVVETCVFGFQMLWYLDGSRQLVSQCQTLDGRQTRRHARKPDKIEG
jgi:hypothetical protein